jgi:hypothetical protein
MSWPLARSTSWRSRRHVTGPMNQSKNSAMSPATRRPCSRPARADGTRHAGSSGLAPNAVSDSSSANTSNGEPRNASISAAPPPPNGDGADRPAGTSTHSHVAITGERQVDRAAHPAVPVAPVTDRHRRPGARHGAARGHRVDERDARPPVERDQLAAGRVDRGDPQHAVRPLMRRQSPGDHRTSHRLGHRGCRQCGLANPLQLLSGRRVGLGHGGHEQVGDVVDVDAGIDLRRRGGHLPVEQRVQADSAAQLGGHRRAGRRAQQHVGLQLCLRRDLVGERPRAHRRHSGWVCLLVGEGGVEPGQPFPDAAPP